MKVLVWCKGRNRKTNRPRCRKPPGRAFLVMSPSRCCTVLIGSSKPPSVLRLMHHEAKKWRSATGTSVEDSARISHFATSNVHALFFRGFVIY
jgi:hypothetical protein